MSNISKKQTFKQIWMNNVLYIVLPVWVILSIFFLYKYIIFTSEEKADKGGTLIEGILDNVSYLPYRSTSPKDDFYQSILFPKCMDYKLDGEYVEYKPDICDIKSKDFKKFYIKVKSGHNWSDGKPVSINDIFFTYHKILKNNSWDLDWGDKYTNVSVVQIDKQTVSVVFPNPNIDNMIFFTKNILPYHILKDANLSQYTKEFSQNPVTLSDSLVSPSQDKNSFVYDLTNNSGVFLSKYQLKKFDSIVDLEKRKKEGLLIDIYQNDKKIKDYNKSYTLDDDYIMLFFNISSKKMNNRIKRALGGLIINNLYSEDITNILQKTHLYLDTFLSNGKGVDDYLKSYNPNLDFDAKDIESLNIGNLPKKIVVENEKKKEIYYIDDINIDKNIDIGVFSGEQYTKIVLQTPVSNGEKPIKLTKRHFNLKIKKTDLKEGLNKYSMRGWRKVYDSKTKKKVLKKRNILDINIYFIPKTQYSGDVVPLDKKMKIIYFKNKETDKIVRKISNIFLENKISQYFIFIGQDNIENFEQEIKTKKYDIVLRTLNLGIQRNISNLFLTDNSIVNPSLYVNNSLASNINKFLLKKQTNIEEANKYKKKIDNVYGNAIPFVILGQIKKPIFVHKNLSVYPFGSQNFYTFHKHLYQNIKLKKHYKPSRKNFYKLESFNNFVKQMRDGKVLKE